MHKGDLFSTTSPLSHDAREFLLSFDDSSEERVLADCEMNDDQLAIAHIQSLSIRSRADERRADERRASAARRGLQARWAEQFGVARINSARVRWWTLAGGQSPRGTYGGQPPFGWPEQPPAWDHPELWGHGRTPSIAVSQPYPWLLNDDLDHLDDFAEEYGHRFRISNHPSWYFPGRCWFVEWFRADRIKHS